MSFIDPRGPDRAIVHVERPSDGGLVQLELSCGHTIEANQHFDWQVGRSARCLPCKRDWERAR